MTHDQGYDVEAYALGALEPHEARSFEEHAASCRDCAAELLSYQPLMRGLRSLPMPAPAELPPRRLILWQRLAAIAAAVVLFAGGGFVGHRWQVGTDRDVVTMASISAGSRIVVAGTKGAAQLRVFMDPKMQQTAFVIAGVPPAPPGRCYQVWLRGGKVRSPGTMRRTPSGLELLIVSGNALGNVRRVGVSVEPAGGSPKRTTPAVVAANVT